MNESERQDLRVKLNLYKNQRDDLQAQLTDLETQEKGFRVLRFKGVASSSDVESCVFNKTDIELDIEALDAIINELREQVEPYAYHSDELRKLAQSSKAILKGFDDEKKSPIHKAINELYNKLKLAAKTEIQWELEKLNAELSEVNSALDPVEQEIKRLEALKADPLFSKRSNLSSKIHSKKTLLKDELLDQKVNSDQNRIMTEGLQ